MKSYTKKNGTVSNYDNHAYMAKSYKKLREKYRALIMCPCCNIEYTQTNKYHHMHTKKHLINAETAALTNHEDPAS